MKKLWIIIIVIVVIFFIVIQFLQPEKNISPTLSKNDIFLHIQADQAVKDKIQNVCYNCHSNNTVYPFYDYIAPVSWIIANDIKRGKRHLNFSEWATYTKKKQLQLLSDICDEVTSGDMPIKSYTIMHRHSRVNEKEVEEICNWTDSAGNQILGN